jgi:RNA polymerase sigma factor (sigma-70 family)
VDDQTDSQLLRAYAEHRSEPAFAELVRRHVDFVYSAARRMVCDSHLAQDVTQGVFLALAKNATQLTDRPVMSGWLHRTAQNIAAQTVRSDVRRRVREQEAAAMNELLATEPDSLWEHIAPHLDAALGELNEADRDALLLRYFERKSAREIAQTLGVSDEAAQKRVSRAVERLREFFAKRGVTVGASGLVVVISANAVQAAPVGLAITISTAAALAATTIVTTATATVTKAIAMTTLQKTFISATVAVLAGAGIYEARQASQIRSQVQTLQQQQAPLAEQLRQFQKERDDTTNRLASLLVENSRLNSNPNQAELLKLRGEVGQLREELRGLPAARVTLLKQKLEEMADKKIPELKFLTEKDWANAVWNADLDTDDGVRLALSKLRDEAVDTFLNLTRTALKKYLAANNDILPADLLPLKSYFDTPVTDEMLQRYKLMQTGKLSSNLSDSVVRKAVYADEDYDSNQEMSMTGAGGGSFNKFHDAIYDATMTFTLANNGQTPSDPSQIAPYLKKPVDAATIQKYFGQIATDIAANPPSPEIITLAPALKAYAEANNGQHPKKPSDLLPYLTTPEQQAAFQKLEQKNPAPK